MEFELWPAVAAGIVGAAAMMVARLALRGAGMPLRMDVTRIWGVLLGVRGAAQWAVGVAVHIVVSVAVAILYAVAFDLVGAATALALWGLAAAVVHWIAAGLMMTVLAVANPDLPGGRESAGAFVRNFGAPDVAGFLIGHLAYGLAVAITYAWLRFGLAAAF